MDDYIRTTFTDPVYEDGRLISSQTTTYDIKGFVNRLSREMAHEAEGELTRRLNEIGWEHVTYCKDCEQVTRRGDRLYCTGALGQYSYIEVELDDFCSCGWPREAAGE